METLDRFRFYYLYGFTNQPNQRSADDRSWMELYRLVIGKAGGMIIANSLHPYFIVNPKGLTVWAGAYLQLRVMENSAAMMEGIFNQQSVYLTDTSALFKEMHVWPDSRLSVQENPVFGRYVPFIIPFLVDAEVQEMNWDKEIQQGIATAGHAGPYVERVNEAIRFFMPSPAFVLGFDEFDDAAPSALVDKFVRSENMPGA